ncbi:MAG: methyltransferase domain-containing protein [Anaerolineales bacterium]|jgi:D-alanine-D-alanine ligase
MSSEEGREKSGQKANPKPPPKTLGPVLNLEEHVRADWWRRIFNALYLKTDSDVVNDQLITANEIDLFTQTLNLSPDADILDLCCGQGRHTLELARRGFGNVQGLDRSHYLIQRARTTAKKESLNIKFREGDARKLPHATDRFDVVMILGNSFGYFETIEDDLRVLREVFRILKPSGQLLIDVSDGEYLKDHFEARTWEWLDKKHYVCRERSLSADGQRMISREIITHAEKGVLADQFYAERLYTREGLVSLIQDAGFSQITVHGEINTQSQRNQDLGMMAQRLVVTALVRKEWTPKKVKPDADTKHVVVVMGDPHRPDTVKPDSVFDDDDFYTIDQLKSALQSSEKYQYSYLDNHDSLIQDLKNLSGKADLILNLCDEGFANDPRQELHVPAIMEMFHLPYTGSGPQCLAYCYDKSMIRGAAQEMGLPVPEAYFIRPEDTSIELPIGFPVIIKPNFGDSSFGITQRSVAHSAEELLNAIASIRERFGYDKPMLVEEFLTGADLTVGVIGNPPDDYLVLPIVEEDYSSLPPELPRLCGYEAKWNPDSPYWNLGSIPADLPPETQHTIIEACLRLFERLECRDYARFDWRLDARGNPKLLEANPNPGWCWDGHLAKMAGLAGLSYADMLTAILAAAERRLGLTSRTGSRLENRIDVKLAAG